MMERDGHAGGPMIESATLPDTDAEPRIDQAVGAEAVTETPLVEATPVTTPDELAGTPNPIPEHG